MAPLLAALHERYNAGENEALLEALLLCMGYHEVAPDWVAVHTMRAIRSYQTFDAPTLDIAFGMRRKPTARSIAAKRKAVLLSDDVVQRIWNRQRKGEPLSEETFDQVAEEMRGEGIKIGKTRVKDYWIQGNASLGLSTKKNKKR